VRYTSTVDTIAAGNIDKIMEEIHLAIGEKISAEK
jgi:hypothetical protein